MQFKTKGRALKFGDNLNVDFICSTKYLTAPREEWAKHCMEALDPDFPKKVSRGDVIVAGDGFGCGLGHAQANIALKDCGVAGIIAKSFGTQFFRQCIDNALPIIECEDILEFVSEGDLVEVDFETGEIKNLTTAATRAGKVPEGPPMEILKAGGLIPFITSELSRSSA